MAESLTREQVERIAALSGLRLSPEEVEAERVRLTAVLGYIDRLSEIDVDGVEPLTQVGEEHSRLRDDAEGPTLPTERLAEMAPAWYESVNADGEPGAGFIRVPKVLGDGGGA
jgi:aspartyl-tRNA(Asn)/glutamyl-tRNA(Gln) amidotransferase subunit C